MGHRKYLYGKNEETKIGLGGYPLCDFHSSDNYCRTDDRVGLKNTDFGKA